jgi:hypothetical protein
LSARATLLKNDQLGAVVCSQCVWWSKSNGKIENNGEYIGNALSILGVYTFFIHKTIFKILKMYIKNMHIYLYILCAYAQFYDKRIYFVDCAKKDKKNMS